jgi:membrane AbrB-like protein
MTERESGDERTADAAPSAAFSFPRPTRDAALRYLATFAVALGGAVICGALGTPLPWLIGPLVAVALVCMLFAGLDSPPAGRHLGQWAIGIALGLYFSPEVMREIARLAPWVVLAIAFAVVLGWLGGWLLARATRTDAATSFFAMAIGGASEMATQAERHGGQVDRVAAAHSLRIMLVVLIVPLLFNALDVKGLDPYAPAARQFSWTGLAVLVAATGGAAAVMERVGSPNSWMIGPLLAAAVITATGHTLSSLPTVIVNGGQLLIGVALGTRFTPEFFRAAPRFLAAVAAITLLYLVAAAGFGMLLALGSGLHWSTAIIATTPGGIGEMALTAQALKLGVPIVTAFHALRMAAIVITIGAVYRLWRRIAGVSDAD